MNLLCLVRWFPSKLRVYSQTPESGKKRVSSALSWISAFLLHRDLVWMKYCWFTNSPPHSDFLWWDASTSWSHPSDLMIRSKDLDHHACRAVAIIFQKCVRFHQMFIPIDYICYGNDECASMTLQQWVSTYLAISAKVTLFFPDSASWGPPNQTQQALH